jgi:hypothetical protein
MAIMFTARGVEDMKKIFFAACVLLICVLLVILPVATALTADDVHLNRIRLGDYGVVSGGYMDSYVFVFNSNSDDTLRDGRVSVRFMDADVYGSTNMFNVRSGDGISQSLHTDIDGALPGEYLVKVSYMNGDVHKTKYRYVTIE